jgi:hypothetical protein
MDVSVRVEVLNGTWETWGADRDIEVLPESVQYEADSWGCLKASMTLRRNPWAAWPDLSPFTPIEIEIGGVIVWIGRTEGTPLKAGAEAQINVQCGGWSQHLDDDLYKRVYVHSMLTDWKDARSLPTVLLSEYPAAAQVGVESGVITIGYAKGASLVVGARAGIFLDLGEDAGKALTVSLAESTFTAGLWDFYCYSINPVVEEFFAVNPVSMSAKTEIGTITNPSRYLLLFLQANATQTVETDSSIKIAGITVFSETAYESAGSSVLKASTVIESALPYAPLLSTDLSQIDTAADEFDIPSLVLSTPQTPRQVAEAVNAFHNWVLSVDLERRMVFAPPSSEPEWEIGAWSGEQSEDASAGEGADIYDAVIVTGTAANGEALTVTVTAAELGATTVVGERGFTRAKTISLSNATDETVMAKIGRVWLEDQLEIPYGGAITAPVGAIRAVLGGQPQHPSLVCRHVNQLLRVSHAVDPSSGGIGRDGRIVSVAYNHAEQSAEITLGARTASVEALLARLAVVSEAGS